MEKMVKINNWRKKKFLMVFLILKNFFWVLGSIVFCIYLSEMKTGWILRKNQHEK